MYQQNQAKKKKLEKKKNGGNPKKFPELKMVANGDYKGQNYTMSSDDELFNVSLFGFDRFSFRRLRNRCSNRTGRTSIQFIITKLI